MAVSGPKSIAPIEQAIISPINESTTFTPGNEIIFRISGSDMRYWLVQDSYFCFDVEWSHSSPTRLGHYLIMRNSSTFFTQARIIHGGNEVYYSQYNIAQQFLDGVKTGNDFMKLNYNEWMCHDSVWESQLEDNHTNYPLIIFPSELQATDADNPKRSTTKRGIIMHVGQILKCFSQCENFPLKNCTQAIEIHLKLAFPNEFVCAITPDMINFYDLEGNEDAGAGEGAFDNLCDPIDIRSTLTYEIKNMRLYMFGAQVQESYASVMDASNSSGQGIMWEYTMPRINLRNEPAKDPGYLISNFQCITENTDKLYIWAVRHSNLGVTIRPHVTNTNIRFGAHQLPKSPTAEDNWTKPALYKELVDDTLEYNTAYYTSGNKDLYQCYYAIGPNVSDLDDRPRYPQDTHILLAASFTTDDKHPGAPSKMWNSQYNLHYQLVNKENPMTWVLAVDTQYVLSLRQGMLSSTNI